MVRSVSRRANRRKRMTRLEEHMLGIWQITTIPVQGRLASGQIIIEKVSGQQISSIPEAIFLSLEPKEIVEIIDKDLSKIVGKPVSILRTEFRGHKKNPFSSQN